MVKFLFSAGLLLCMGAIIMSAGCDKQKIVESTVTEYVEKIEYVQLPPDTIFETDTIYANGGTDTIIDTVNTVTIVHDTVIKTNTIHDTVIRTNNVYIHDTIRITDTVIKSQYVPNAPHAMAAMQYHTDPMVLEFILQEFGVDGGWIYYLSGQQMEITQVSSSVYDIYAYVDYWTEDFASYYPLEIYWRLTYKSGDPANPANWQMTDPPAAPGHRPGVNAFTRVGAVQNLQR